MAKRARRKSVRLAVALLCVVVAAAVIPFTRMALLDAAGRALVLDDPVGHADAIAVTSDAGIAGIIEAAELVRGGIASRVALPEEDVDPADLELRRRVENYEDETARSERLLRALGVDIVDRIPGTVAGSNDEARALAAWCSARHVRSVVVVSSRDHSRRLHRIFRRAFEGAATAVMIHAAPLSRFDPDRWWQTRGGTRIAIIEWEKLLLDVATHPIS